MANDTLKQTINQVRNGYGVETTPQYLAEFFPAYDQGTRAKILNDMDAASESFEGETQRETGGNLALRAKLEAVHQALIKARR
jgi:hypothetical protein